KRAQIGNSRLSGPLLPLRYPTNTTRRPKEIMYIPKAFEETRIPVLHELIRSQPFSSLVTLGGSGLVASHLPLVLEEAPGSLGLLKGHLSRANPQWRDVSP